MKRILLVGALLPVGALLALALGPTATAQDPSAHILSGLQTAADRGDQRAQEALADLDAFAARLGLDASNLTSRNVSETSTTGRVDLSASGIAPFWIDVTESVDLGSTAALNAYLLERRAAAGQLAGGDHRGRLSMGDFVDLDRLCEVRDLAGAVTLDAEIDVWLGETWVTRFGYGPDAPDFWRGDCGTISTRARAFLAQTHSDDPLGAKVQQARLTIHGATLSVPTKGVAALMRETDVLLFDPEEDLLAPWAASASHVRLVSTVDVFGAFIESRVRDGLMPEPFVPGALSDSKGVQP